MNKHCVQMDGSELTEFLFELNHFYYLNARMHLELHERLLSGPPFVESIPFSFSLLQHMKRIAIKLIAQIER